MIATMADEFTIAGEIQDSPKGLILDISDESKSELVKAVKRWRKPGPVTIRIREGKEPKSLQQLKYIHGKVFRDIADETGNAPDLVKDELKKKFLSRVAEFVDMETGEVTTRVIVPSLADLTIDEMNRFIDECVLFAGEFLGMTIEAPDPAWKSKRSAA